MDGGKEELSQYKPGSCARAPCKSPNCHPARTHQKKLSPWALDVVKHNRARAVAAAILRRILAVIFPPPRPNPAGRQAGAPRAAPH